MITPMQIKGARSLLGWSGAELALRLGVKQRHVTAAENGRSQPAAILRMKALLQAAGVEFTYGVQPGVKIKGS